MNNETTKVRLYIINRTEKAMCVSKVPKDKAENSQGTWLPKSIMEHVSYSPPQVNEWQECVITMPEWIADKRGLL
jgi:hypothetical protein